MATFLSDPGLVAGYLSDESGYAGSAEGICFPESADEAAQALALAHSQGKSVTVQGARTGFYGKAVPRGGYILNLSKLNHFLAFEFDPATLEASVTVEAGMTLGTLEQALQAKRPDLVWNDAGSEACWRRYQESCVTLFFPPNPTESSATLGGVLASSATGSHDHTYGGANARASHIVRTGAGAGGQGVITACTLKLAVKPEHTCALFAPGTDYAALLGFLRLLDLRAGSRALVAGAELFDRSCFQLAWAQSGSIASFRQFPVLPASACAGLCLELAAGTEDALLSLLEDALEAMECCDLNAEMALAATAPKEVTRMLQMRHLLTEAANALSPGKPKYILDHALPAERAESYPALLSALSRSLAASRLRGCLFGHAGTKTVHLRILPENEAQGASAAQLVAHAGL